MTRSKLEEMTDQERIVHALERIAAAAERVAAALEVFGAGIVDAEEGPDAAPCVHPEDKRADRSVMGRVQWTCKVCGFEFSRSAAEMAAEG